MSEKDRDTAGSDNFVNEAIAQMAQWFGLDIGGLKMISFDAIELVDAPVPAIVVAAKTDIPAQSGKIRTVGICVPTDHSTYIGPEIDSREYFSLSGDNPFKSYDENEILMTSAAKLIKVPEHGNITLLRERQTVSGINSMWYYSSDENYTGDDNAEFLVEILGIPVRVVYFFKVTTLDVERSEEGVDQLCKKSSWIISQSAFEDNDFANWYGNPSLQALLSGEKDALGGFADLSGAAATHSHARIGNAGARGHDRAAALPGSPFNEVRLRLQGLPPLLF
jgi:hypothetical protein